MINNDLKKTMDFLKKKNKILFLLTSNRWDDKIPKSSQLAYNIKNELLDKDIEIINVSELNIMPCEGNVSQADKGNHCGSKESNLKSNDKNPSGNHRCWCSINNDSDELWKISKSLLESDCVIFFGSIRWGKMNAIYAKLIERLTWLENRHTSLGETNLLENIDCGIISTGHNWNGQEAIELEKKVLTFFGFNVVNNICWSYQWTKDSKDETLKGYKQDVKDFKKIIVDLFKKVLKFKDFKL